MGTGTNQRQDRSGKKGLLAFVVTGAAFFAFAAPAMAAPTVIVAPPITVDADGPDGSEVDYDITATDADDPTVVVTCAPPSGSLFGFGVTNVACNAFDSVQPDNTPFNFNVTVNDTERSDLAIDKFASKTKASPGDLITYTFRVTNHGPSNATNVKVRDPGSAHLEFVSGDAGCGLENPPGGPNAEIVCNFGSVLGNGVPVTKNVVMRLHASHHSGEAPNQHDFDVMKLEQFVSPPAGGGYPTYSLSCPVGYTATDGSARTDSVDQGTGTRPGEHDVENLHFVRSESNTADRRQWDFTLQNHASGQAQAHLFIVCLRDTTGSAPGPGGSHFHSLKYSSRADGVLDMPGAGRYEITLSCPFPLEQMAIAPSFEFVHPNPAIPPANPNDPNGPHGPQYKSIQSADGTSWTFGFQVSALARVQVSIRCLERSTTTDNGHFETLAWHHAYSRVTVAPFAGFGNSGPWTEARQECPVHYKGIVATWRFPKHVKPMGNTPEPINRDFRIFNKSPLPKYAHIDLLCLKIRTHDDLNGGSVRNTARVYGDQPDWNFGNNFDFWDLEDPPLDQSGAGSSSGDGSGSGGDGSGSGGGGDTGAGSAGSGESGSAGSGESGSAASGDDMRQERLKNCVKNATKIGNKKKRHKAMKNCRDKYGVDS